MIFNRDHQPLIAVLTYRYRVQTVVGATMNNRYTGSRGRRRGRGRLDPTTGSI
jgi:hypothetical protein